MSQAFFEAAKQVWGKAPKEKKYTVTIEGKEIEVSLEKNLEIMKHGEEAFMLQDEKIVRRPIKKNNLKKPILKKQLPGKLGYKFYDNDPLWVESVVEEGFSWQIESE
jgi:hypothetical protein|tara:strand:+ start:1559 stop:1879 length:321 start_codon:yes stop_codon:yes gene_type:complete